MRSLSSQSSSPLPSLVDIASPRTSAFVNPNPDAPPPLSASLTASPLPTSPMMDSMTCSTPATYSHSFQQEILELKTENIRLKEELKVVLDHSIESDTRLLQYNEDVFVVKSASQSGPDRFTPTPTLRIEAPARVDQSFQTGEQSLVNGADEDPARVDQSSQTGEQSLVNRADEDPARVDQSSQTGEQSLVHGADEDPARVDQSSPTGEQSPVNGDDEYEAPIKTFSENETDLVTSLRTTIEVLEAELQLYRNQNKICKCSQSLHPGMNEAPVWKSVDRRANKNTVPKKQSHNFTIPTKNRFTIISKYAPTKHNSECLNKIPNHHPNNRSNFNNPVHYKQKIRPSSRNCCSKTDLPFKEINIDSDSHGRNLSALLMEKINSGTSVTAFCKPSARLKDVIQSRQPSPQSCTVIIAGTNDVASGQQSNIYEHLEGSIKTLLPSSKVLLSTLPWRHDLDPGHRINEEITFINAYILEIAARLEGVEVLDFNKITRRAFTKHGMHLTPRGKRYLATLVMEGLQSLASPKPAPFTLPYESYADAVKSRNTTPEMQTEEPQQAADLPNDQPATAASDHQQQRPATAETLDNSLNLAHCTNDFLGEGPPLGLPI